MTPPLSILDLVPIHPGHTIGAALEASVELAQLAERAGYRRVWYAEHHNMPTIGSAATSVVIAHVGARTSSIRLGAGGVMLPNHAPLAIAEQFGTLEALYPGRIDLGLGRAPGSDQKTMMAMRRTPASAGHFPQDVVELQGYFEGESVIPGVNATPGNGAPVPLYILGSSIFGARLAAAMGLPYAFASHFAPAGLTQAVTAYRTEYRPSARNPEPYVIAGVNVVAAGTAEEAAAQFAIVKRNRARSMFARQRELSEAELDQVMASHGGRQVEEMLTYSAVGTPGEVRRYLLELAGHARADELMTVHHLPAYEARSRSVEMVAECMALG